MKAQQYTISQCAAALEKTCGRRQGITRMPTAALLSLGSFAEMKQTARFALSTYINDGAIIRYTTLVIKDASDYSLWLWLSVVLVVGIQNNKRIRFINLPDCTRSEDIYSLFLQWIVVSSLHSRYCLLITKYISFTESSFAEHSVFTTGLAVYGVC